MDEQEIVELMPDVFDYDNDGQAEAYVDTSTKPDPNSSIKDEVESEWVKILADTMRKIAQYTRILNLGYADQGLQPETIVEALRIAAYSQAQQKTVTDEYDIINIVFQGLQLIEENIVENVTTTVIEPEMPKDILSADATNKFSLIPIIYNGILKVNNNKIILKSSIKEGENFIIYFNGINYKNTAKKINNDNNYLYLGNFNEDGTPNYEKQNFFIKINVLTREAEIFTESPIEEEIRFKISRHTFGLFLGTEIKESLIANPHSGDYVIDYEDFNHRFIYHDGVNMAAKYQDTWNYYSQGELEEFTDLGTVISVKIITNDLATINSIGVTASDL